MTMDPVAAGMTVAWALFAAFFSAYVALVAREVTYVTLADGRRQERSLPVVFKILLPLAGNFSSLAARPSLAPHAGRVARDLVAAGFEGLLDEKEFIALEILSPIALGTAWIALVFAMGFVVSDSVFTEFAVPLDIFGIAVFAAQPLIWLKSVLKQRHMAIARALPFVLDVLTLSVEAGMDFISAMQRNCSARKMDALNEELLRMTKEIQVGVPRREALKRLSERVNQPDLKSVANALIQADELGVSIGSMLRIQADQMRERRFDRAERLANEAPTKMIFPLMLCIFPAVFIILLGPVIAQSLKGFGL